MKDQNLHSFAGNPSGELFYTDPDGVVTQLRQAGDLSPISYMLGSIVAPSGIADALKVSGAVNLTIIVHDITGGYEDCIDINHSSNVTIYVEYLASSGLYVSTIKASDHVTLLCGCLTKHGTVTDFDLGNWSDQSTAKTRAVILGVKGSSAPVQVRQLNAEAPRMVEEPSITWKLSSTWSWCFLPVYRVLKALHLV